MGVIGASLIGTSIYLTTGTPSVLSDDSLALAVQADETAEGNQKRRRLPTLTSTPLIEKPATPESTATSSPTATSNATATPTETALIEKSPSAEISMGSASDVAGTVTAVANTTTPTATSPPTASATALSSQDVEYVEPYTSTAQVQPPPSANAEPGVETACPTQSTAAFDLIPIEGRPMADHPDFLHGDLNLSLRGYSLVTETLELKYYNGNTDPSAPRLHGLFEPNRVPDINHVYQINEWIWDSNECGGTAEGCRGGPLNVFWPVTLAGLAAIPGEFIYAPERGPEIYPGGYTAIVLYAEERRITLGYTRRDNVAAGYTVHLESVCIDPNLLALYQAQRNANGRHTSGFLPALRNNQPLGTAFGDEIKVAIRDAGSFMDPRSHKDWWVQ